MEFAIGGQGVTFKFAINYSTKRSKQAMSPYLEQFLACAGWRAWSQISQLPFPAPGSAERVSLT